MTINKENGYIPLFRSILEWEWYKSINVYKVFTHCLLKANYTEKKVYGFNVGVGEFITSYKHLADETGLSVQNVRTALKKLQKTGELTMKTTNKYTIISINNYAQYNETNKQITNNQQATNKQLTTTNKDNKDNKDNNILRVVDKDIPTTTQTNDLDEQLILGEYKNVVITRRQYNKQLAYTKSEAPKYNVDIKDNEIVLFVNSFIQELSENIATGNVEGFNPHTPNKHAEILHKYRRQKLQKCNDISYIQKYGHPLNEIRNQEQELIS